MKFAARIGRCLAVAAILAAPAASLFARPAAAVDCAVQLPTESQLVVKTNIQTAGEYRLWLRYAIPTASTNQIVVAVDNHCPFLLAKSEQRNELMWLSGNDQNQQLLFNLTPGEHTITIAGEKTGVQIDKVLFTNSTGCTPGGLGDNCLIEPPKEQPPQSVVEVAQEISAVVVEQSNKWTPVVIASLSVALLGALVFLVWRYHAFIHHVVMPATPLPDGVSKIAELMRHGLSWSTARHFIGVHRLFVVCMGVVIAVLLVLLSIAIVRATEDTRGIYEAESGALSGGAKIVQDAAASGGAVVAIGEIAVAAGGPSSPSPTPTPNTPGTPPPSGGGNGGGGGGGSDPGGGGGGGTTPTDGCPAFPAFPDENCTGWQHTGVTLHECETDGGYIWDSNLTFDSCYFPQALTIFGANITITRSQIHGTITPHWSKSYNLQNMVLRDVEIEETGNPAPISAAIAGHNYRCTRCNVHHTGSGMHAGDNTIIEDSYTHDFIYTEGAHGAGIGIGQGHGSNSQLIHNNIQCNRLAGQTQICSSALSIYDEYNDQGQTVDNILVKNNLFNTVGAYCTYAGGPTGTNIRYIDNYFGKKFHSGCGGYGPLTAYAPNGGVWSGNIWADGSGPVNP